MQSGKIIKVCGMTKGENIQEIEALGVDFLGMIFYPKSPRFITEKPSYLPSKAKKVGVFVNTSPEVIQIQDIRYRFDYIQLHGNESPEQCKELIGYGFKLSKAFSIETPEDIERTKDYDGLCEYFLFDTKCKGVGGSGKVFDWSILDLYKGETKFLLSGGLSLENIDQIKAFKHDKLAGYDLNSRFETEPGIKDTQRIKEFIQLLKYEQN
ncbi:MAG: phosphoribosylanthranilate isomerase [Bacteroidales bacterium]|nr:phosphoribosylanthranilate isomerase [Bacteroidales bacterium]